MKHWAIYILIFLAALGLRLIHLDRASLWLDEVFQITCAVQGWRNIWDCYAFDKPPLDYYIGAIFLNFGENEFWGRFHAALFGAGFVAVMAAWGRQLGGWKLGALSAAIVFASPLAIRYSQEIRPYSLMLFSETLFLLFFTRILFIRRRVTAGHWIACALSMGLMLWSLFLVWPFLFFCGVLGILWLFSSPVRRRVFAAWNTRQRQILIPSLFAGLMVLGALPILRGSDTASEAKYLPFDVQNLWKRLLDYCDIYTQGYEWYQVTPGTGWVLLILLALALLGAVLWKHYRPVITFLFLLIVGNIGALFFMAWWMDHWMEVRYTMAVFPPILMMASIAVVSTLRVTGFQLHRWKLLPRRFLRSYTWGGALLVALVISGIQTAYVLENPMKRPDWHAATQHFARVTEDDSTVYFFDALRQPFQYYCNQDGIVLNVVEVPKVRLDSIEELRFQPNDWGITREMTYGGAKRRLIQYHGWNIQKRELLILFQLGNPAANSKRADQLAPYALGPGHSSQTINVNQEASPFTGRYWYAIENWGEKKTRALARGQGEFLVPVHEPLPLRLTMPLHVYGTGTGEHRAMGLLVNGTLVSEKTLPEGQAELSWEIPEEALSPGVNTFLLQTEKTYIPAEMEENSQDKRHLSAWASEMTIEVIE